MSFNIDYKNVGGGIVPEGTYEAVIKAAYEDATPKATIYINVPLVIRNDIEQPYKNAYIWHAIWKKKEPNDADRQCGGYVSASINMLSKAAGIPNGKPYASLDELFEDLKGKPIRIKVKHEQYNGKTQAKVESMEASKFLPCRHVFKQAAAAANAPQEYNMPPGIIYEIDDSLDDEELPF